MNMHETFTLIDS